jgi:hypothetical protein
MDSEGSYRLRNRVCPYLSIAVCILLLAVVVTIGAFAPLRPASGFLAFHSGTSDMAMATFLFIEQLVTGGERAAHLAKEAGRARPPSTATQSLNREVA